MVIAEIFQFHRRAQAADESIAEFDAALRKLATHCEFGETLEEALRDRFVCGLRGGGTTFQLGGANYIVKLINCNITVIYKLF